MDNLSQFGEKVVVLLPAFNEEGNIGELLRRVSEQGVSVVVVDDGSEDRTAAVVAGAMVNLPRLFLVRHGRNRGLGAAIRTGFEAARRLVPEHEVLVTMDADGSHDPALIPDMVDLVRGGAGLVVASRFARGGREVGLRLHRRLLSRGARLFMRGLFPIPGVKDYSSGYRAYSAALLSRAADFYGEDGLVTTSGFDCMAEILVKLRRFEPRCREVPLVLRYDRKRGPSKVRYLATILGYLRLAREARALPDPARQQRTPGQAYDV